MDSFVEASKRFTDITGSLDQFERARRIMLVAAQETINIQKDFNESLQNFVRDFAYGGAIRHLVDLGYDTDRIIKEYHYPLPRDVISKMVLVLMLLRLKWWEIKWLNKSKKI